MKKIKLALLSVACLSVIGALASCGDNKTPEEKATFSLNESNKELVLGDSFKLIPTFSDSVSRDVSWASTNSDVANVDEKGFVTSVGTGNVVIIAQTELGSQKCTFSVTFGSLIPTLHLKHIVDDKIVIQKGDSFTIESYVNFNGIDYDTDPTDVKYDTSVISYSNSVITGLKVGTTKLSFDVDWFSYDKSKLSKEIEVEVIENVEFITKVTLGDRTIVSNKITLYTLSRWNGETFFNSAILDFQIKISGVLHEASYEIENNETLVRGGNRITSKDPGINLIKVSYEEGGKLYSTTFEVEVLVPVSIYTGEELWYSLEEAFPVKKYFGNDARILEAYQGERLLTVDMDYLTDLVPNGAETESLTVITNKGGYIFPTLFSYTVALTKDNIVEKLTLVRDQIITGYYVLKEDIDEPIDFTGQIESNEKTYFAGIFDGLGHTFKAITSMNGIFGGLGGTATVKNTHFEFTFNIAKAYAVGLAKNTGTYYSNKHEITLNNLKITTTNYYVNTFALFYSRNISLKLKQIYVELTGTEYLPTYDTSDIEMGALFGQDVTSTIGSLSSYKGDFMDVYVITGKFMPLSCSTYPGKEFNSKYVCYAKTDYSYFGQSGADFAHVGKSDANSYSIIYPTKGAKAEYVALYGLVENTWHVEAGTPYAVIYDSTYSNGGVMRYNNISEMPVSTVGSWDIKTI